MGTEAGAGTHETLDAILRGRVKIAQRRRGYRFTVDALLLADFIRTRPDDRLLDIGTGHAVIPLILFRTRSFRHVTGLEVQRGLAALAKRNARLNGARGKVSVVKGDVLAFRASRPFDAVFSNPPYRVVGRGRLARDEEKAVARHELRLTLRELFGAARRLLRERGRFTLIHLPERRAEMDTLARELDFSLWRERLVCSRRRGRPVFVLREFRLLAPRRKPMRRPPLVLFTPTGRYTREAQSIFAGRRA
ncbi:MAG: tRNA (adenine(22)-N(1))-methyltransferase TrmK [Acidobacteriota bacterium]|nr:MAG: tRNA (adenine(22)-N(1))-methyltransferase TrmK [Acidobacteriota bacterium]